MLPNANTTSPKKIILCLHSVGSSGSIFKAQLSQIELALQDEFEMLFLDAPFPSQAGPGILPIYQDMGPFFSWLDMSGKATVESQLAAAEAAIRIAIEQYMDRQCMPQCEIVAVLGFSLGAMLAIHLLWQQQRGRLAWLPKLRFATLLCPYFPEHISRRMHEEARLLKNGRAVIDSVPSLHLFGARDIFLRHGRRLLSEHFEPGLTNVIEWKGGHECPRAGAVCRNIARQIVNLSRTLLPAEDEVTGFVEMAKDFARNEAVYNDCH